MLMQKDETKLQQEFSKVILNYTKKLVQSDERVIIAPKGTQHKTLSDCLCIKDMASADRTFMFTAVDAQTEDFKLLNGIKLGQTEIGKLIIHKLSKVVRKFRRKYKGNNILFYFKVQQIILHAKQNGNRSIRLQGKFQVYKMNGTYEQQFEMYKTILQHEKQEKKKIVEIDDDEQPHQIIFKEADQHEEFEKTQTNRSESQRDIEESDDDSYNGSLKKIKHMKKGNKNKKAQIINDKKISRRRDDQSDPSFENSKNMDNHNHQTLDYESNSVSKSRTNSKTNKISKKSQKSSTHRQAHSNKAVSYSHRTNTQISSEYSNSGIQVSSVSSFTISEEQKAQNTIEEHSEPLPNIQNQWSSSHNEQHSGLMHEQSNHSDIANTTQMDSSSSNQEESSSSSENSSQSISNSNNSSQVSSQVSSSISSHSMDIEQPISTQIHDSQNNSSIGSNNQNQASSINDSSYSESSYKSSTTNGQKHLQKLSNQIQKVQKILFNNLSILS